MWTATSRSKYSRSEDKRISSDQSAPFTRHFVTFSSIPRPPDGTISLGWAPSCFFLYLYRRLVTRRITYDARLIRLRSLPFARQSVSPFSVSLVPSFTLFSLFPSRKANGSVRSTIKARCGTCLPSIEGERLREELPWGGMKLLHLLSWGWCAH